MVPFPRRCDEKASCFRGSCGRYHVEPKIHPAWPLPPFQRQTDVLVAWRGGALISYLSIPFPAAGNRTRDLFTKSWRQILTSCALFLGAGKLGDSVKKGAEPFILRCNDKMVGDGTVCNNKTFSFSYNFKGIFIVCFVKFETVCSIP